VAPALFGWPQLNAALAQHRLGPPRLKLEKDGRDAGKGVFRERRTNRNHPIHDVDVALLQARLRDGATLILDAVNELGGPLQQLCAGLADEFSAASQANLYACWGTNPGFDIHWDDHDVFVIQLDGAKRWRLYGPTRAAPLRRDLAVDSAPPTEPLDEIVLQAGDLLYLPRGYWHAAVGTGGPTLHLTVGLTRKTGHDLLTWLADQALAEDIIRHDLPLEQADDALGRHVAAILSAAIGGADPADLGRRFRRHVQARRSHRPELSFPFIGQAFPPYDPRVLIRLSDGAVQVKPAADPETFILRHRGVDYTLAGSLKACIAAMALGQTVTFGELLAASAPVPADQAAAFLADMVGRGVFVLTPA
jgi:ribosomal protein L16 Arg81 hydroxylase